MNLADIVRKVLDGNTYMVLATAGEVPGDDISRLPVVRSVFAGRGRRELTPAELRPPAPYRLYRATVTEHSVLCPRETGARCARHGLGYDHRTAVPLP